MFNTIKSKLVGDDRAVSPVIGVILMVAITVILAAVIASMTLGLGDSAQTAPQAKFDFDQQGQGSNANVTISHQSGASINSDNLNVTIDGSSTPNSFNGTVSAGSSMVVTQTDVAGASGSGSVIRVVWTSDDGSTSSTLATYTVQ